MLGEDPGQGRGQVVAQAQPGVVIVLPGEDAFVWAVDIGQELAQRLDSLDRRGLERVEAIMAIDLTDPVQHLAALEDVRAEIVAKATRSFGQRARGSLLLVLRHSSGSIVRGMRGRGVP